MEAPQDLVSIRDFIRWGVTRFTAAGLWFGHGTDNALDEASQLVLQVLHLPLDLPPHYLDSRLTAEERGQVAAVFRGRIEDRKPAPYLTQRAWFAGLEFYVTQDVLIPRSPIAELIEARFVPWTEPERVGRILDLCSGSGCIGIAAAAHLPQAQVDLAEISEAALRVAADNLMRHGLEDRVALIRSDLFEGLSGRRYDIILSNPPYVSAAELASLPPEYSWEPRLGLDGGPSGLDLVRRILREAPRHLNPGGLLIVEVGTSAGALEAAFPAAPFLWLEFERGGEGVFLLTAAQLRETEGLFARDEVA